MSNNKRIGSLLKNSNSASGLAIAMSSFNFFGSRSLGAAVSSLKMKVAKAFKVVKDSYGRRKIQRKQTPYKGGKFNYSDTKRQKFWDKVRATHSYNPDPRPRHFWHAAARNRNPVATS